MEQSNKIGRLCRVEFIAEVTIDGEYTMKQMVPFRDKLYLLIERPDGTPELYFVDDDKKQTVIVQPEGLSPPEKASALIDSMNYRPEY